MAIELKNNPRRTVMTMLRQRKNTLRSKREKEEIEKAIRKKDGT
ncbi:hypothetical protein N9980_00835 [bacterium]|nr:hypothetical protein [bacterium]